MVCEVLVSKVFLQITSQLKREKNTSKVLKIDFIVGMGVLADVNSMHIWKRFKIRPRLCDKANHIGMVC